ncbi:GAK system ATP-grasp enzyme [Parahaliea mediterranea]|uniref:GAK system ATP-grasp enzyme n=1 Tax=Parahaliea mediterranea TaxID=651086 RepID=A0A939DGA4_9GAMM|nr:GAK system ATP-grasp enzyme [Parahaliea mediterranea]MBN7797560.1 GAK system ATP-grasp enzyme [Parahaliea mediterranea]
MTELKVGVIGIPGKWSTEALADALESRTGFRRVIDMAEVVADLDRPALMCDGLELGGLDAVVVKKISRDYSPHTLDRLELLRLLEQQGVRVFSPAGSMLRLIDRLACTVTLRNAGIPMPQTRVTECPGQALAAVREFGSAVFKPLYSTKARGMRVLSLAEGERGLKKHIARFHQDNPVMYIQRKLELPGRDLGLVYLGGEYLGAYARISRGDAWNTTIHSGGKYAPCEPGAVLIELGRRAQAPFALDFTTVDIAETEHGPVVFEVSAFGGFRGAREGAGIDAAAAYADYVLQGLAGQ